MLKSPPEVISIVPRKEKTARFELKVLDAYISHISLWSSHGAQNDSIRFDNAEVAVSPWVAKMIHRFCNSTVPTGEVEDLVAWGVALIAKCRTDLASEVIDLKNLTEVYSRQAEMMLDVAVGTIVVRDLQVKCNELLAAGNSNDVRELNQLQHETRKVVQQVRCSLNEKEKERASELATAFQQDVETGAEFLLDLPERSVSSGSTVASAAGRHRDRAPRSPTNTPTSAQSQPVVIRVTEASSRPGGFRWGALSVVAVAIFAGLAIYGVAQHRVQAGRGNAAESLATMMSNESGITHVQDRRPYLVLTVHADFWDSTSGSERRNWIRGLSRLAERHGYSGLAVRSSSGVPLAEWVRGRGISFPEDT